MNDLAGSYTWAYGASYLGGFVGGIMLVIWVWRSRGAADCVDRRVSRWQTLAAR